MPDSLSLFLAAALLNNIALVQLFGVSSLFLFSKHFSSACEIALLTLVLFVCAGVVNALLYHFIILPLGLDSLVIIVFGTVNAALCSALVWFIKTDFPLSFRQQGSAFYLAGANSALLAAALNYAYAELDLISLVVLNFGSGLGFSATLIAFSAMRIRLSTGNAPQTFQGTPVLLISAGIAAMGFLGLRGAI